MERADVSEFQDILESLLAEVAAQETAWVAYDDKYETQLALYILSHNFDVVATIRSMSSLSWEQGFNAGRAIVSICERTATLRVGEDSGD